MYNFLKQDRAESRSLIAENAVMNLCCANERFIGEIERMDLTHEMLLARLAALEQENAQLRKNVWIAAKGNGVSGQRKTDSESGTAA